MIHDFKRMMQMDRKTLSLKRIIRALFIRFRSVPFQISWHLSNKKNLLRLKQFKDIHKGKRCFIIGNGPSLNKMDLSFLKDEITFGQNRINLLFDKMGFKTTYHVAVNDLVIKQFLDEIKSINVPSFVSWETRKLFRGKQNYFFLMSSFKETFSPDILKRVGNGATVTYTSMHLAYYMGFEKVYLIGVDHNFKEKELGRNVISNGNDQNHFDPNYFGKGIKWGLANLPQSERAYRQAKKAFEKDGRYIYDATVDGKLEIFEKVSYKTLF